MFIIIVVLLLCVVLYCLSIYEVFHFPRDSIANYPNTQWRCDELGLEVSVDKDGNVLCNYNKGSDCIALDVFAMSSTTWHSNFIVLSTEKGHVYLHCFYSNIQNGIFYSKIEPDESTLDLSGVQINRLYKFTSISTG